MKNLLEQLEALVESIEAIEPTTDSTAYVRRELLQKLDEAHEMLAALAADGYAVQKTEEIKEIKQ